jgi:hypothetical protein
MVGHQIKILVEAVVVGGEVMVIGTLVTMAEAEGVETAAEDLLEGETDLDHGRGHVIDVLEADLTEGVTQNRPGEEIRVHQLSDQVHHQREDDHVRPRNDEDHVRQLNDRGRHHRKNERVHHQRGDRDLVPLRCIKDHQQGRGQDNKDA